MDFANAFDNSIRMLIYLISCINGKIFHGKAHFKMCSQVLRNQQIRYELQQYASMTSHKEI